MESFVKVRSYFYGSHTLKNHPTCGRGCGHFWTVDVTVAGEEATEHFGMVVDEVKLRAEMRAIASELNGKDIAKMLKPALSSPAGISYWFHERLASRYDVREVLICQDDGEVQAILRAP